MILHKTERSDSEKHLKTRKDPWQHPVKSDHAMGIYNFTIQATMQEHSQKHSDRNDQSDVCTKSNRINYKVKHEMLQSKRKDAAGTIKTKYIL